MSKIPHQKQYFTAHKSATTEMNAPYYCQHSKKVDFPFNKSYNVGNTAATPLHDAKLGRLFYAQTKGHNV